MKTATVGLLCLMLLPLPAAAADKLKVDFENKTPAEGWLVLTRSLSDQYFPQNANGPARLAVTLIPDVKGVLDVTTVEYAIRNGKLTASVPFKRHTEQPVSFELTLFIPDNKGKETPFVAFGSIARYRSQAHVPREPQPPPPASQPPAESLRLTTAEVGQTRPLERLTLKLSANRKSQVEILIQDSKTGFETRRKIEVDTEAKPIAFEVPSSPNLALSVLDEQGKALVERAVASFAEQRDREFSEVWRQVRVLTRIAGAGCILSVVLLALAILAAVRHFGKRKEPSEVVQASLEQALRQSTEALGAANEASRTAQTAHNAILALEPKLSPSSTDEQQVRQIVGTELVLKLGSDDQLRSLASSLSADAATIPAGSEPEHVLLAVVNKWLGTRSGDRIELKRLAQPLGLKVELYAHRSLTKLFSDLTRSVYEFEPSERDGAWLWMVGSAPDEFLAVPTDASFFHVHKGPDLLIRLFDGMEHAGDLFRFRRVYRACRLRRAADGTGYVLATPGVLQLEGQPPPDLEPPPDYDQVRAVRTGYPTTGALAAAPLATVLRTGFRRLSEGLQRIEGGLGEIRQQLAEVRVQSKSHSDSISRLEPVMRGWASKTDEPQPWAATQRAQPASGESATLRVFVAQANRKFEDLGARMSMLERDLLSLTERLEEATEALRVGHPTESGPPSPTEEEAERVPSLAVASASREAAELRPVEASAQGPAVIEPSASAMSTGASVSSGFPTEETTLLGHSSRPGAGPGGTLPEGWQDALRVAANKPGVPPRSEEITKGSFLCRLLSLSLALSDLRDAAASPVRIVHLYLEGDFFEVHDTDREPGSSEERWCKRCQRRHCFQLAVCAGAPDDEILSILYPLGVLVPSNYPAGYGKVVERIPDTPFLISEVRLPAGLRRREKDGRVLYWVTQKLQWSS
jgi:hypothetical protein